MNYKFLLQKIVLLALLYYIFGLYSLTNTVQNSIVTISPFFSEGFSLAFVLLYGYRVIPGVFLGQFILAIHTNLPLAPSLLVSLSNSLEALLAYYVLKKLRFDVALNHLRDVYVLVGVVVFVLQPFSAFVGCNILRSFSLVEDSKLLMTMFSWYFGNIIGQLLVTPTFLYLYRNYKKINYIKLLFISVFFALLCYNFIIIIPVQNISLLFSITIVPLVLLLSYENGLGYALFSVFIISLVAISTFQEGVGIFSIYSDIDNIININFYILSHILIILVIGVLIIEKNQAVKRYKRLNTILEEKVFRQRLKKTEKKIRLCFFSPVWYRWERL